MKGWKYRSREFSKDTFYQQKEQKKQTDSTCNFLQPPIQVGRGAYIPYFKINAFIFSCSFFFEEYLNPQVKINKMVDEHTVNYHPTPLELISRIGYTLSYYYGLLRGLSLQDISWVFSRTVCPIVVAKKFQIHGVEINGKYICESKNKCVHLYSSCP